MTYSNTTYFRSEVGGRQLELGAITGKQGVEVFKGAVSTLANR